MLMKTLLLVNRIVLQCAVMGSAPIQKQLIPALWIASAVTASVTPTKAVHQDPVHRIALLAATAFVLLTKLLPIAPMTTNPV